MKRARRSEPVIPGAAVQHAPSQALARRHLPVRAAVPLQAGADPAESLRSIRRANVGRWWVTVMPRGDGFRAEAHTMTGPPGAWAGPLRGTLRRATDDGVAMLPEFESG